jgi:hypothetical protein
LGYVRVDEKGKWIFDETHYGHFLKMIKGYFNNGSKYLNTVINHILYKCKSELPRGGHNRTYSCSCGTICKLFGIDNHECGMLLKRRRVLHDWCASVIYRIININSITKIPAFVKEMCGFKSYGEFGQQPFNTPFCVNKSICQFGCKNCICTDCYIFYTTTKITTILCLKSLNMFSKDIIQYILTFLEPKPFYCEYYLQNHLDSSNKQLMKGYCPHATQKCNRCFKYRKTPYDFYYVDDESVCIHCYLNVKRSTKRCWRYNCWRLAMTSKKGKKLCINHYFNWNLK